MSILDLCGRWGVRQHNEAETIPATVPGCIHTDLLASGKIDDPYYRDNERRQMWIGETDWMYSRKFIVDAGMLEADRVLLQCDGLDTLSTIILNGITIGKTNNQFRSWEFDVKPHLHTGENSIEIRFDSTIPYVEAEQKKRHLNLTGVGQHRVSAGNRIRKSQCNYGWDWGPMCVTAGIWRPIRIVAFNQARISDLYLTQNHEQSGTVELGVSLSVEADDVAGLHADVTVSYDGQAVHQQTIMFQNATNVSSSVAIENPHLWWPNGLGEQSLYEVKIELVLGETVLDTVTKRIGLRTLILDRHPDQWGESFQFVANGIPFFAKGANWIPADTFITRITPEHYEDLIKSAVAANMNMLRIWGGGIYEEDIFYDLCDKYGICIWQDFMFACSAYPAFDAAYLENVKHEAIDNVKRLRHHPSLALWCGNNEIEQIAERLVGNADEGKMTWEEYDQLFENLLPDVVQKYDPQRSYWPSSPHSSIVDRTDYNNPTCGDAHLWDVWHQRKPFEWYRTCEHRFNSEFGFQSFPEPEVVKGYTLPEDRNVTSYVMEHHQRSPIGNDAIIQYMLSWYKLPTSFDMLLWMSQILHGMAMKYAVEHWRRSMPRGMGTLYWQINDCWPVASWASIDYDGNWKALNYMARDFYAPLLISAVEDGDAGTVEVHVTNDFPKQVAGKIHWTLTDTDGKTLMQNTLDCSTIAPCADTKVCLLDIAGHLKEYGKRRLLVWLELEVDGKIVSTNAVYFSRPKHLMLQDPELRANVRQLENGSFAVSIDAKHPALWVWPDVTGVVATYSNRFFHLAPGKPVEVQITPKHAMSLDEFQQKLTLSSLTDTYK